MCNFLSTLNVAEEEGLDGILMAMTAMTAIMIMTVMNSMQERTVGGV